MGGRCSEPSSGTRLLRRSTRPGFARVHHGGVVSSPNDASATDETLREACAQLQELAEALAAGIADALPGWVLRAVETRMPASIEGDADRVLESARIAGASAAIEVGGAVADLLSLDVERQPTNPLALLRAGVRYPTEVLRAAGVEPVDRDPFAVQMFPHDAYDLAPASFADLDPSLQDVGIAWGAAKAFVILSRRRLRERREQREQ